jgi:hypothetical protein
VDYQGVVEKNQLTEICVQRAQSQVFTFFYHNLGSEPGWLRGRHERFGSVSHKSELLSCTNISIFHEHVCRARDI